MTKVPSLMTRNVFVGKMKIAFFQCSWVNPVKVKVKSRPSSRDQRLTGGFAAGHQSGGDATCS